MVENSLYTDITDCADHNHRRALSDAEIVCSNYTLGIISGSAVSSHIVFRVVPFERHAARLKPAAALM